MTGRPDSNQRKTLHTPQAPPEDDLFVDDFGDELDCTHCGGNGECDANADPLWDCDEIPHPCHACGGSGRRRDQRIF